MSLLSEAHRVLRRPRYSIRRLRAWKTLRGMQPPYRLNLGCGLVRFDGWTNIDLSRRDTAADIAWNLCDGLPVGDETCELIYSEHVLEHFALSDGLNLLHECRRALTPTGVLRIAISAFRPLTPL